MSPRPRWMADQHYSVDELREELGRFERSFSTASRCSGGARPGRFSGRPNATNVAALINSGRLLVLELLVAGAAAYRLITGTPSVDGLPVLIVGGIAALGALILRSDPDDEDEDEDAASGPDMVASSARNGIWPLFRDGIGPWRWPVRGLRVIGLFAL
jgi:hypothetical protein